MKEKRTSKPIPKADVPYDVANNADEVSAFWETATKHRGVEELSAKRRRPTKAETDRQCRISCLSSVFARALRVSLSKRSLPVFPMTDSRLPKSLVVLLWPLTQLVRLTLHKTVAAARVIIRRRHR
jgi:hypothetical protein